MAYCTNCGQQIDDKAKFCSACGTPKPTQQKSNGEQRKTVYEGEIRKCPNCGEVIDSFTAKCPSCGFELNSKKVSSALQDFINSINEYDRIIANDPEPPKTGFKTWGKGIKILWVILNLLTSCIPLVVYLVFPLIKPFILPKSTPVLSADEKRKASLIENYAFPNEREATIEAMLFTKSKMAFLASEKFDKKTLYWTNLWNTKAEQLNQRAGIILKGDPVVETTYNEIVTSRNKVQKAVKTRAIIGASIIIAFLVFILVSGSLFKGITNITSLFNGGGTTQSQSDNNFEWMETGLSTKLPKIDTGKGHIYTNDDNELWLRIDDVTYNQFESYITSCKDMGYSIDAEKDTHQYTAYNDAGYFLELSCWTDSLDIKLKAPLSGDENFKWPEHKLATIIPKLEGKTGAAETEKDDSIKITLYGITSDEFKSYVAECEKQFSIDTKKSETSFEGFNSKGYEISVSLGDMKNMTITVKDPLQLSKVSWPSSGPATLLPKPSFEVGKISSDYDWTFSIYIGDTTIDEFNDYIEKCISKGFVKDYRSERYFSAEKGDDIDLTIEYVGYNTVYISITNYDEF